MRGKKNGFLYTNGAPGHEGSAGRTASMWSVAAVWGGGGAGSGRVVGQRGGEKNPPPPLEVSAPQSSQVLQSIHVAEVLFDFSLKK